MSNSFRPMGKLEHFATEVRDPAGHVVDRIYFQGGQRNDRWRMWSKRTTMEGKKRVSIWTDITKRPAKKEVEAEKAKIAAETAAIELT